MDWDIESRRRAGVSFARCRLGSCHNDGSGTRSPNQGKLVSEAHVRRVMAVLKSPASACCSLHCTRPDGVEQTTCALKLRWRPIGLIIATLIGQELACFIFERATRTRTTQRTDSVVGLDGVQIKKKRSSPNIAR